MVFPLVTPVELAQEEIFTFRYLSKQRTETACAKNDIFVNGQELQVQREEYQAYGSGILVLTHSNTKVHATWQITCLPEEAQVIEGLDGVQVFTLTITSPGWNSGFTVSYEQHDPGIIQFTPYSSDLSKIKTNGRFWRTPSSYFSHEKMANGDEFGRGFIESSQNQQTSLMAKFHRLQDVVGEKMAAFENFAYEAKKTCEHRFAPIHRTFSKLSEHLRNFFCHPTNGPHALSKYLKETSPISTDSSLQSLDMLVEVNPQDRLVPTTTSKPFDATDLRPPSVTHTRSMNTPAPSDSPYALNSFTNGSNDEFHRLRTMILFVVLAALFAWLYRHIKDPRRRADRAARREERRRRFLYQRAAKIQAWRNWFCTFRHKYCLAAQVATSWDEKRARVLEQEEILESVMKDDIRALRRAHRAGNIIGAAEEGRASYIYEIDSRSDRRRSVATLPGYESEGTQPPGYESDVISVVSVVDGFQYTPAENEDTPDSSVVSTSPRISRDGRDSDFEKDNVSEWTLEPRPVYNLGP